MAASRYLEKFENLDASLSYTFPLYGYEYEPNAELQGSFLNPIGRDFPIDLMSGFLLPFKEATETAHFTNLNDSLTSLDTDVDNMKRVMHRGMDGYLYTLGADGSRRRARARILSMPSYTLSQNPHVLPVSITWQRLSHWGTANGINVTQDITSNGQQFVVNNPGNVPALDLTITLQPLASAGMTNPLIKNLAPVFGAWNFEYKVNRTSGATTQRARLRTAVPQHEWSTTSGSSYAEDWANYQIPNVPQWLGSWGLQPGNNTIEAQSGGTVNFRVTIVGDAPFY